MEAILKQATFELDLNGLERLAFLLRLALLQVEVNRFRKQLGVRFCYMNSEYKVIHISIIDLVCLSPVHTGS